MYVKRDRYLERLKNRMWNGSVKVITGIRRCGKSFLLSHIFRNYLISEGVKGDHIIFIDLDRRSNRALCNPDRFLEHVNSLIHRGKYFLMVDEVQLMDDFVSVLNEFVDNDNVDVYVTGSNSKFLSTDIITEFRGRGDEIHMYPLSFSEYFQAVKSDRIDAWNEYCMYGGMPALVGMKTDEEKASYLSNLIEEVYLRDVIERNHIENGDLLDMILLSLCSSIGSLTNPLRTSASLKAYNYESASNETVARYITCLEEAFIFEKSLRYDVRGKEYFSTPSKYYATDVGLRNSRLKYRQQEMTHIMENVVYNELRARGYDVDVGIICVRENDGNKRLASNIEIDFVANKGGERLYIQSAFSIQSDTKRKSEVRPLRLTKDSFRKIIVTGDMTKPWVDDEGVMTINIIDFLLSERI